MKSKTIFFSILVCMLVFITGCVSPEPVQTGRLYVRTLIDGKDMLYIRGDSMWFEHQAFQLPGQWAGENLPVYVNQDQEWTAKWNGTISDVVKFTNPDSVIPSEGTWDAETMMVKIYTPSYGAASVREYPTPGNRHTLVIELDDIAPDGAHWYYIDIDWDEMSK